MTEERKRQILAVAVCVILVAAAQCGMFKFWYACLKASGKLR